MKVAMGKSWKLEIVQEVMENFSKMSGLWEPWICDCFFVTSFIQYLSIL